MDLRLKKYGWRAAIVIGSLIGSIIVIVVAGIVLQITGAKWFAPESLSIPTGSSFSAPKETSSVVIPYDLLSAQEILTVFNEISRESDVHQTIEQLCYGKTIWFKGFVVGFSAKLGERTRVRVEADEIRVFAPIYITEASKLSKGDEIVIEGEVVYIHDKEISLDHGRILD